MGLGDALSSIFGGGNDYRYVMPPNLASPQRRGESAREYQTRISQQYQGQNREYDKVIRQAMNREDIPQNVLDFSQANETAAQQNALDAALRGRMGQNINFGTKGSMAQQQGLIDQVLAQGRGEGPNPALDQLRLTTDQNVRQQAAMAAGAKGINPALAARLVGQQGAGIQQQSAGQAALQAAQQQVAAQQLGGGLLGQQIGQRTQQAGINAQQQALYAQLLAGTLGQQRGQDITQASNQGQAGLNLLTANTNAEALRRQAQQAYQNQIANIYNSMNAVNAGVASQNAATNFQYGQGAMAGLSSALGAGLGMNEGGMVDPFKSAIRKKMADGGMANFLNYQQDPMAAMYGQLSQSAAAVNKAGEQGTKSMQNLSLGLGEKLKGIFDKGPIEMADQSATPAVLTMMAASDGGKVEGNAKVEGDSEENDIVPALLSPGEIVIPRSALESPEEAHAFLDKIIQKHEGPNYKEVMKAKEKYHNMAHGGEMYACKYCYGGMA